MIEYLQDLAPYLDPRTLLEDNEFAQGALLAGILTWLGYQLRALPQQVFRLLRRRFVSRVEVRDPEVFSIFAHYLSEQDYASDRCRRVSAELAPRPFGVEDYEDDEEPRPLQFSPARGVHVFRIGGWPFWLSREKEEVPLGGGSSNKSKLFVEYFVLNTVGLSADRAKRVLEKAYEEYATASDEVPVYTYAYGWMKVKDARSRTLESVVLPGDLKENLVGDLERFFGQRERYERLGVPYRRGYLLEGPPGSGKSSIVRALATKFRRPLYTMPLRSLGSDSNLASAMNDVPSGSIVLFEDVDASGVSRDEEQKGVTFSGLLNALDGVASQESIVYIFTTNKPETLDAALTRPGRIDRVFHVGSAAPEQAEALFTRFFPDSDLAPAFAKAFSDLGEPRSMASIQSVLQRAEDSPEEAVHLIAEAEEVGRVPFSPPRPRSRSAMAQIMG